MARIKERHDYHIFGIPIPIMKKFVYEYENKESLAKEAGQKAKEAGQTAKGEVESKTNGELPRLQRFQRFNLPDFKKPEVYFPIAGIIGLLVLAVAYFSFEYISVQNCPEKWQYDNSQTSLQECQTKFKKMDRDLETAREQMNRFSADNVKIAGEKNELVMKVEGLEDNVKKLEGSLESAKQRVEGLGEENKILREKKETLIKDLDDTKYKFGKCKNKNMDHEVRSMELLQEVEGLKKELKACK